MSDWISHAHAGYALAAYAVAAVALAGLAAASVCAYRRRVKEWRLLAKDAS